MTDHVLENWKHFLKEESEKEEEQAEDAGAGFIIICPKKNSVLLLRKSDTKELSSIGGGVGPGEEPYDAALREAREEVGLDFENRTPLKTIEEKRPDNFTYTTHVLAVLDEFKCNLNEEHDAYGWVNFDELEHLEGRRLVSNDFFTEQHKEIDTMEATIFDKVFDILKKELNFGDNLS